MPLRDPRSAAPSCCLFAVLLALAFACAGRGGPRPASIEVHGGEGFTITERVSAGGGTQGRYQRALASFEQGRRQEAVSLLLEVTEAAPHLTAAHVDLGVARARVGDLAGAEASLRRALELTPRHPLAHNELGIVLRRTGRFDAARSHYEEALEIYPAFHHARLNLGILCDLYLGDLPCALEHYELYRQAVPEDESVNIWMADLRNRVGAGE